MCIFTTLLEQTADNRSHLPEIMLFLIGSIIFYFLVITFFNGEVNEDKIDIESNESIITKIPARWQRNVTGGYGRTVVLLTSRRVIIAKNRVFNKPYIQSYNLDRVKTYNGVVKAVIEVNGARFTSDPHLLTLYFNGGVEKLDLRDDVYRDQLNDFLNELNRQVTGTSVNVFGSNITFVAKQCPYCGDSVFGHENSVCRCESCGQMINL